MDIRKKIKEIILENLYHGEECGMYCNCGRDRIADEDTDSILLVFKEYIDKKVIGEDERCDFEHNLDDGACWKCQEIEGKNELRAKQRKLLEGLEKENV